MLLSALQFKVVTRETDFVAELYVEETDTITTDVTNRTPHAFSNVYWDVSGVDTATLDPIPDDLSNTNYWFSYKHVNIPLVDLNTINANSFSIMLSSLTDAPAQVRSTNHEIYMPIMPYLSGGTSIQVYYVSSANINTPPSTVRINLANTVEVVAFDPYQLNLPVSGYLSGIWLSDIVSTPNRTVSGMINYATGNLSIDLTHIPASAEVYVNGLSDLYIKFEGNYPATFNTTHSYICAAKLNFYPISGDTKSYYVTAWSTNLPAVTSQGFIFNPKSLAVLETNYNYTSATLSAVYKQRDSDYTHLTYNEYYPTERWPYSLSGRAMVWKSSSPLWLSAHSTLPNTVLSSFEHPISGWSMELENIVIYSNYPTATTFQLTAYFPDDSFSRRTSAIYTFNYDPPVSDDLKITVLSETLTSECLRVYRQVNTSSNIIYSEPLASLAWSLVTTTLSSTVTACSGVVPADLNNERYYACQKSVALTGGIGLISAVELYSNTAILTGYDNVYGLDYLTVRYDSNPAYQYTLQVAYSGNPFAGSISAYDTHNFQVYTTPVNIAISAIRFDNQPFTRSLTARAMNDLGGGVYIPIHYKNKIKWGINQPTDTNLTALKIDGSVYTFNADGDDTIILNITTPTFDLINTGATLYNFILYASAYDTYHTPTSYINKTSYNFSVDSFPASSLFDSYLMVNYENSKLVTDMWRASTVAYSATAYDMTSLFGYAVTGTRSINGGNGTTSTESPLTITYTDIGTYPIILSRTNVSAVGWLEAHSAESTINLHLVNRILSAAFIIYPTYVFTSSATQSINSLVVPITSRGVSAYDTNHTEPFILSAYEPSASIYQWIVDNVPLSQNTATVTHNRSALTPLSGVPVSLGLYNNELPFTMPKTYLSDSNGTTQNYSNYMVTTTANNPLFSNIKILNYDSPTITIDSHTNNITIPVQTRITATNTFIYPNDTPIIENSAIIYWTLSTPNWTVDYTSNTFDYNVTIGNDDTVAGVIKYGATYPLSLILNRKTYTTIANTFAPNDWGLRQNTESTSVVINYLAVPELLFVPTKKYNVAAANVMFVNMTTHSSLISAFYVNDGYHTANNRVSAFDDFVTSYPLIGTYSLYVTGVLTDGNSYTNTLQNIVTIISSYEDYNPDISRIYGATDLTLPHQLEDVRIPPNEWATADNFNHSIVLMNDNLNYLRNMTKFYSLPPTDYIGWLGSTVFGITTSFGWQYNDFNNYIGLSGSVENATLSSVTDILQKDDILYIADTNEIKLYNTEYIPTLLNTINTKTIDDTISQAKSISLDSTKRLYVLDKPKHRVLVFSPYIAGDPNSNEFLFEWGGLGGIQGKSKFNTPNDLIVDIHDNLWVCDTANTCVKKFSRTGSWLQTIDLRQYTTGIHPDFDGIISLAFDSNDNIHILTTSTVYKFEYDGTYINSYTFRNDYNETPQKIIAMHGGGFLYICLKTSIIKVQESGAFAGIFANDILNANFTSIYHDEYKELYVANVKNILKYFESHVITRSSETSVDSYVWTLDDITVDKDSAIQDWVCNIAIKRFLDNLELFRRSLTGEIEYVTNSKGLPEILIRNFTPAEYTEMYLVDKDLIFIAINELVTADVLNRCITQIYNSMENIKQHI